MAKLRPPTAQTSSSIPPLGPKDDMPPEYWEAVLKDPRVDARPPGKPLAQRPLSDINEHVLRVACRRCERVIEIQRADAIRLFGPDSMWKPLGQRLLNDTCCERTGRYEEDGCWPSFE